MAGEKIINFNQQYIQGCVDMGLAEYQYGVYDFKKDLDFFSVETEIHSLNDASGFRMKIQINYLITGTETTCKNNIFIYEGKTNIGQLRELIEKTAEEIHEDIKTYKK